MKLVTNFLPLVNFTHIYLAQIVSFRANHMQVHLCPLIHFLLQLLNRTLGLLEKRSRNGCLSAKHLLCIQMLYHTIVLGDADDIQHLTTTWSCQYKCWTAALHSYAYPDWVMQMTYNISQLLGAVRIPPLPLDLILTLPSVFFSP